MKVHHADLGGEGKPPLVILHGLLGSSRNWRTAGADLAGHFHVSAVDLRNHGESPHAPEHTYEHMAADVLEWLDDRGIPAAHVLGHSLGGKVVMQIACRRPERVLSSTIVDIAPRAYRVDRGAFEALLGLDLSVLRLRRDAEHALHDAIPDRGLRLFLLSNLERTEDGRLSWRVNLPVLADALPALRSAPLGPEERFDGPTLFVRGGKSPFIRLEDHAVILRHFPRAVIRVLPEAGHYPQVEQRPAFVEEVRRFIMGEGEG